jgi:hypothetical protein
MTAAIVLRRTQLRNHSLVVENIGISPANNGSHCTAATVHLVRLSAQSG